MRLVDYICPDCGAEESDVFFIRADYVVESLVCHCGGDMQRQFGAQVIIDDWTPRTNDAQRDMEHFAKKSRGRLYRIDQQKQNLNSSMNLKEV